MIQVDVQSIHDSVMKGTLVDLSSDYRTSRTVKSYLPQQALCAMSASAFSQHILQGSAGERRSRIEAICTVLGNVLRMSGAASQPRFDFSFHGEAGLLQRHPLKLEWFAPNKYWVVLLPDEHLQTVEQRG